MTPKDATRMDTPDALTALRDLLNYLDEHDWGLVPECSTADRARAVVAASLPSDDIASAPWRDLCEGDGQHSEQLDKALIRKHLARVVPSADRSEGITQVIAKWREKAQEVWQWWEKYPDGARRDELMNQARIYENCANELASALASSQPAAASAPAPTPADAPDAPAD